MKRRRAKAAGETDPAPNRSDLITPSNAKRAIAVGKVLAPVLLPIAMRAAGAARGAWDDRRARRLGVAPSELTSYSGKGGALHARIDGIAGALLELRATSGKDGKGGRGANGTVGDRATDVDKFAADTEPRLIDLAAAVRAAELMPTERRRAAHRAVATELDRIEPQLLKLLGVSSPVPPDPSDVH
ncbi:MAG TPA: DUF6474 family protein [Pseudonocardia sp.]|nr:DUF6474 family protein [Pseudonocardia sp.]